MLHATQPSQFVTGANKLAKKKKKNTQKTASQDCWKTIADWLEESRAGPKVSPPEMDTGKPGLHADL